MSNGYGVLVRVTRVRVVEVLRACSRCQRVVRPEECRRDDRGEFVCSACVRGEAENEAARRAAHAAARERAMRAHRGWVRR